MPGAGEALRGRTFGIPNLALLAAVAAGIWWFFLRKPAGATTAPNAAAAGSQLQSGYGLGFAQGLQAATPGAPTQGPTPSAAARYQARAKARSFALNDPGVPIFSDPQQSSIVGYIPFGAQFQASGPAVPGKHVSAEGQDSSFWIPYQGGYISGIDAVNLGAGGGVGGGAPRKFHSGSRSAWLHHDAHPLIGSKVNYAHFVRVGGPRTAAAHRANINHVAQQAGVHPARVAMLNPVPTGLIRIA